MHCLMAVKRNNMNKLQPAFDKFDAYNMQDPRTLSHEGITYPFEYFYALQLHKWVTKLEPAAGDALLLASRCQHIGRWEIARTDYPEGKAGYLNWRKDLAKFHASKAGELMTEAGYDDAMIKAVQHILLKEQLKMDNEVQAMENALCLVFLEFQYEDFLSKHDDAMMINILRKTWKKMSEPGRTAALNLHFSDKGKALIEKALGS